MSQATAMKSKYEDDFGGASMADSREEGAMTQEKRALAQSRKAYYRELKKVIEASDVVIEVLDARDPEGCRSEEIE
jgi:nuclear GTP-binding protein